MKTLIKKTAIIVLIAAAAALGGCGGNKAADAPNAVPAAASAPAAPAPQNTDLQSTIEKIRELTEGNQWASLYDYLAADIQKTITKEEFVNLNEERVSRSKIKYRNYKMAEPKAPGQWVNNIDGRTYQNVTEVPYTVDVETPKGEMKVNNAIHLVQTPEKYWRYLWIRK